MMFERYESYRSSGIDWLGDIPSEWEVKRVKDYTKTFSGTTPRSGKSYYYDNGNTYWVRTTDLNNSELFKSEFKVTKRAFKDYSLRLLPFDSVLIAMYGGIGTMGKNALVKVEATLNQSVCAIVSNIYRFDSKFLLYFMQYFRYKWILFADSARKDPNINQDAIKNLFTIFPPLKTQQKIATYLDNKTKKIDKEISLLEQKIEKYKELKQTLINETVLRGLDKEVELKDSGIEWIGKIPENCKLYRLDLICLIIRGNSAFKKDELLSKGEYVALQYGKTYQVDEITDKFIFFVNNDFYKKSQVVHYGDTILISTSETIEDLGHSCFYKRNDVGLIGGEQILLKPKTNLVFNKYLYYFSKKFSIKLKEYATGLKVFRFNTNNLKRIDIPLAPLKEQKEIANYLDNKTNQIDQIIKTIQSKITLQKEFRKTLINDVVTGKVKV
jgi:type I restriction enzyme S subunit